MLGVEPWNLCEIATHSCGSAILIESFQRHPGHLYLLAAKIALRAIDIAGHREGLVLFYVKFNFFLLLFIILMYMFLLFLFLQTPCLAKYNTIG